MAPAPWILLHRRVSFVGGGTSGMGKQAAAIGESSRAPRPASGMGKRAATIGESSRASRPGEAMAVAMKPDLAIDKPPEVTRLFLQTAVEHLPPEVKDGMISSTHHGLAVLYTGMYRPGNSGYSTDGCYLVYDASNSSVSKVPPLPSSVPGPVFGSASTIKGLGISAAILRHNSSDYIVAELVTTWSTGLPCAELYLWWSSPTMNPTGQWLRMPVRLPLPLEASGPTFVFHIDMAFASGSSMVCWVDLLIGVVTCDLTAPHEPKFRFIPLPERCQMYIRDDLRLRLVPQEFRSMSCVAGDISFVALIGYTEQGCPLKEVALETWTSSDFKTWKKGSVLSAGELWAGETFRIMGLPQVKPMCPILSMNENVICVSLNDIENVPEANEFGDIIGNFRRLKAHYVVLIDLLKKKVLFSTKEGPTHNLQLIMPHLLSSDFPFIPAAGDQEWKNGRKRPLEEGA